MWIADLFGDQASEQKTRNQERNVEEERAGVGGKRE